MLFSKGQLADYAKVSPNVITSWLREDVVLPLQSEGRNNAFSLDEMRVARIAGVLYREWRLPNAYIKGVADQMRYAFATRDRYGLGTLEQAKRILEEEHVARLALRLSSQEENHEDSQAYRQGIEDGLAEMAHQRGLGDWRELGVRFSDEDWEHLSIYRLLLQAIEERSGGHIILTRNEDSSWTFLLSAAAKDEVDQWGNTIARVVKPINSTASSFLVIDLAHVFSE